MNRRRAILAASAALFPSWAAFDARSQAKERVYRVAWAVAARKDGGDPLNRLQFDPFRKRLAELGFEAGRNLQFVHQVWRAEDGKTMVEFVREVIALKPDLIVSRGTNATMRYKVATSAIPIVFAMVHDPVSAGLVASLARPGGNLTGVMASYDHLALKALEVLRELLPRARRVGVLIDSSTRIPELEKLRAAAANANLTLEMSDAKGKSVADALVPFTGSRPDAVLIPEVIGNLPYFEPIVDFQNKARIPVFDTEADSAERGMVVGLGEDNQDVFRKVADITAKILLGARPSEIPIEGVTHVVLWVNERAALRLSIVLPPSVVARADRILR